MLSNTFVTLRAPTWVGAVVSLMSACTPAPKDDSGDLLARGEYLVEIAVCDDCHSPKVMTDRGPQINMARRLSGYPAGAPLPEVPANALGPGKWAVVGNDDFTAWAGPWGISFGINLTSDKTGIGLWTEQQFIDTLRTGLHLGVGREVLPPMPWPHYSRMTDGDLRAVYAYLMSLPPIENIVPQPMPPGRAQLATPKTE